MDKNFNATLENNSGQTYWVSKNGHFYSPFIFPGHRKLQRPARLVLYRANFEGEKPPIIFPWKNRMIQFSDNKKEFGKVTVKGIFDNGSTGLPHFFCSGRWIW